MPWLSMSINFNHSRPTVHAFACSISSDYIVQKSLVHWSTVLYIYQVDYIVSIISKIRDWCIISLIAKRLLLTMISYCSSHNLFQWREIVLKAFKVAIIIFPRRQSSHCLSILYRFWVLFLKLYVCAYENLRIAHRCQITVKNMPTSSNQPLSQDRQNHHLKC